MPRVKLAPLAEFINPELSLRENTERLYNISKGIGIEAKVNSIEQFITKHRRRLKIEASKPSIELPVKSPVEIKTHDSKKPDIAIDTFDSVIESLYALRKYISDTVEENSRMKEHIKRIKELLE